jgi:hypothetical protein
VNAIHERDGGRCVGCGRRAESVHHRVHGNRKDMRASNLLSVCGDGVAGCHGFIEAHPAAAMERGWTVSRYAPGGGPVDTTMRPVWLPFGLLGKGWYLLDDAAGLNLVVAGLNWPEDIPPIRD